MTLPLVVGMVAFSIDVGLMTLLRTQLQNSVDAGALAASISLENDPTLIAAAETEAKRYVQLNRVGTGLLVPEGAIEVEVGQWNDSTQTFLATENSPNAVRVFARQDDEPYFFGQFFGYHAFGAPASAIASGSASAADIMLVLDLSGSMASSGRIEALQNSAPLFIDMVEGLSGDHQVGVMGLSADPGTYDPVQEGHNGTLYNSGLHPTDDHHVGILESTLGQNWSNLKNNTLSSSSLIAGKYTGWTGTGAAVGDAAHYMTYGPEARSGVNKVIILMSDGYANRPSGNGTGYAKQMATYAAGLNITIYTISLGNSADQAFMQEIADLTGGTHFDASGTGEATLTQQLTDAFKGTITGIKLRQLVQ